MNETKSFKITPLQLYLSRYTCTAISLSTLYLHLFFQSIQFLKILSLKFELNYFGDNHVTRRETNPIVFYLIIKGCLRGLGTVNEYIMEQEKGHLFERQETLLPINSQEACFCIKDAWDGLIRPHPINSKIARWRFRTRIGPFSYLVWAAIWLLIGLTFLEEPNWCAYDSERCHSTSSISDYYPRYNELYIVD